MVTFAICGIWHGVGTTYLAWGLLFGIYLTFSNWSKDFNKRMRKRFGISIHSWPYMVYKTGLTFLLVLAGWIIFRAESIEQARQIFTGIFTVPGSLFYEKPSDLIFSVFGIAALVLMDLKQEYFRDRLPVMKSRYSPVRIAGITMIVITILLAAVFDGSQFIYFQF
jgi:alginate O-acetyltransferase complex protein AlgI